MSLTITHFKAADAASMAASFKTPGTNLKNYGFSGYHLEWGLGTAGFTVRLATAAALAACTPAGTGPGHTLTENANGALTIDGVTANNADRVLIKDQVAQDDNGIYVVTDKGSAGTPFILTRATDFDQAVAGEIAVRANIIATAGTVNTGKQFELTTTGVIVVDTTNLVFDVAAPVGTWSFEGSNDSTDGLNGRWRAMSISIGTQPAGVADGCLIDLSKAPWEWARGSYARISGTGTVDAIFHSKAVV